MFEISLRKPVYILVFLLCCFSIQHNAHAQQAMLKPLITHFKSLKVDSLKPSEERNMIVAEFSYEGENYKAYYSIYNTSDTILRMIGLRMKPELCPKVIQEDVKCSLGNAPILEWISMTYYDEKGQSFMKNYRVRVDVNTEYYADIIYSVNLEREFNHLIAKPKDKNKKGVSENSFREGSGPGGPSVVYKFYGGSAGAFRDSILRHVKLDASPCVKRFANTRYIYQGFVDKEGTLIEFKQVGMDPYGYGPEILRDRLSEYLKGIRFPKAPYVGTFYYEIEVEIKVNGSLSVVVREWNR